MGDIVEEDRTCLTVENSEACAMIKQKLKATGQISTSMEVPKEIIASVMNSHQTYQSFLKAKTECTVTCETKQSDPINQQPPATKDQKSTNKSHPAAHSGQDSKSADKPSAQPQSWKPPNQQKSEAIHTKGERKQIFNDLLKDLQLASSSSSSAFPAMLDFQSGE